MDYTEESLVTVKEKRIYDTHSGSELSYDEAVERLKADGFKTGFWPMWLVILVWIVSCWIPFVAPAAFVFKGLFLFIDRKYTVFTKQTDGEKQTVDIPAPDSLHFGATCRSIAYILMGIGQFVFQVMLFFYIYLFAMAIAMGGR